MRRRDLGRKIKSEIIGRPLYPDEVVHHKDGNHYNNSIENLVLTTRSEHIRLHKPCLGYKFTEKQKKKLSETHKGQPAWNKGKRGLETTDEVKFKISNALTGRKITWGDRISEAKTKVKEEDVLSILKENIYLDLNELKIKLGITSNTPIQKLGGIKKLKEKARNEMFLSQRS